MINGLRDKLDLISHNFFQTKFLLKYTFSKKKKKVPVEHGASCVDNNVTISTDFTNHS